MVNIFLKANFDAQLDLNAKSCIILHQVNPGSFHKFPISNLVGYDASKNKGSWLMDF